MPVVRNAFKLLAADAPLLETSLFIQLYSPRLLEQLQTEDLFVGKLLVVRGSPGSGKSTLLRLFETETLLSVHSRRLQKDQPLVEKLEHLGILTDAGPKAIGIYLQCDSTLRDIGHHDADEGGPKLFYTLLDVRIISGFLQALRSLASAGCIAPVAGIPLEPLPMSEAPPSIFSERRTVDELESLCGDLDRDFGTLLNSFPDAPLPPSLRPHARLYSLSFLAQQFREASPLHGLIPIVMLDDFQELPHGQRSEVRKEFLRRSPIVRWLSVRTHALELDDLMSLEGADEGREFREIALDELFVDQPSAFTKFATDVIQRRLQTTEALQDTPVGEFKDFLQPPPTHIPKDASDRAIVELQEKLVATQKAHGLAADHSVLDGLGDKPTFDDLLSAERALILYERKLRRDEFVLFPELESLETADGKTEEAARLFLTGRLKWPYYSGFGVLTDVASGNVEQLLSVAAEIADRMIYRAELDRPRSVTAREQEEMLRRSAERYYELVEERHRHGSAMRQFVDNLGVFCKAVTGRPNAPIAPGVTGFGLTLPELSEITRGERAANSGMIREVLKSAVAGNVLLARNTKQGQAGTRKVVFYLNRLLCVKFRLPLNYGGWQHLPISLIARMIKEPVPLREMDKRSSGHMELT